MALARTAALFLRTLANDYQQRLRADCTTTCSRFGFSLDVFSADNNAEQQLRQIQQFLKKPQSGPAAILVSPVRENDLLATGYEVARKGWAWVILNRASAYLRELRAEFPSSLVFSVNSDQYEIGSIQGRQFKLILPKGGELFYLRGPMTASSAQRRLLGVEQELADTSINIVTFSADWSGEAAEKATRDWLRILRHPEPSCLIGAQNDDMAMGARRGLMNEAVSQNRPELRHIRVTGCDGSPTFGQRWVAEGALLATVVVPSVAGTAIEEIASSLDGGCRPPVEVTVRSSSYPELDVLTRSLGQGSAEPRRSIWPKVR